MKSIILLKTLNGAPDAPATGVKGKRIDGLSDSDAAELVDAGAAEYVAAEKRTAEKATAPKSETAAKKTGNAKHSKPAKVDS